MSRRKVGREHRDGEHGLTLVEMLMSMLILGILFSAAAGALMSFSKVSVNNEHRVQSTALMNRLHEELQALHWDDAVLYTDEVAAMPALDGVVAGDPPTFEGADIVVREGPGCDVTDPDCRIEIIPSPHEVLPPIDDRDYEVYRIITWADRDGAGAEDIKRYTTIVRWEVFGRTVEQRFDSERAPTPGELSEGNPSIQFLVSPSEVELDEDDRNQLPIELSADFSLLGAITAAEVRFNVVEDGALEEQVVTLAQQGISYRYRATIPAGAFEFEEGPQTFLVVGQGGTNEYSSTATVTFVEAGGLAGDGTAPEITNVVLNRNTATVGRIPPNNNRLCHQLTVTAMVSNVRPGASVTANYLAATGPTSVTMVGPDTINLSGTNHYTTTFALGADSPWRPSVGSPVTDRFTVVAQNADSGPSASVESNVVTFSYSPKNNERC